MRRMSPGFTHLTVLIVLTFSFIMEGKSPTSWPLASLTLPSTSSGLSSSKEPLQMKRANSQVLFFAQRTSPLVHGDHFDPHVEVSLLQFCQLSDELVSGDQKLLVDELAVLGMAKLAEVFHQVDGAAVELGAEAPQEVVLVHLQQDTVSLTDNVRQPDAVTCDRAPPKVVARIDKLRELATCLARVDLADSLFDNVEPVSLCSLTYYEV
jgi:hypothetical protein